MGRRSLLVVMVPLLAACSALPAPRELVQAGRQSPSTNPSPRATLVAPQDPVTLSTDPAVAFRINPDQSGGQEANLITRRLSKQWSRKFPGPVSYPVVAGGRVFVTVGNEGAPGSTLYALDERSGKVIWGPIDLGGTYGFSAAAYDQGRLFVQNGDGLVMAFDAATGAQRWSVKAEGQRIFSSPPTAWHGTVFTAGAGSGGTLYAFSEASGALLWQAPVMNGDSSAPVVSAAGVYVSYACVQAYGFKPLTGAILWHHEGPCEGGGGATAALYQGKLYARDGMGNLVLDAKTGAVSGTFSATAPPAFAGDTGFFLAGATLRAVELATRAVRWSFAGAGSLVGAPVVSGGTVFTASSSGAVFALNASTGALVAAEDVGTAIAPTDEQNQVQRTGLTVGDGLLLVPAGNSLFAY